MFGSEFTNWTALRDYGPFWYVRVDVAHEGSRAA